MKDMTRLPYAARVNTLYDSLIGFFVGGKVKMDGDPTHAWPSAVEIRPWPDQDATRAIYPVETSIVPYL